MKRSGVLREGRKGVRADTTGQNRRDAGRYARNSGAKQVNQSDNVQNVPHVRGRIRASNTREPATCNIHKRYAGHGNRSQHHTQRSGHKQVLP